ncbi:DUF1868 domain-containing protein [Asaia prunellae]|uniref:DUF1868 domain-containing protein n=1 Tax=Asaia prunellae TaxID=610245 RepID=UPI000A05893F
MTGRRDILLGLGALVSCGAAPVVTMTEKDTPACDSGLRPGGGDRQGKFDADGKPRFWPGNTIICPFGSSHPLAHAMLDTNTLIQRDWSAYITPTPPSSYHMTVLGGVDAEQVAKANWPEGSAPQRQSLIRHQLSVTAWRQNGSISRIRSKWRSMLTAFMHLLSEYRYGLPARQWRPRFMISAASLQK